MLWARRALLLGERHGGENGAEAGARALSTSADVSLLPTQGAMLVRKINSSHRSFSNLLLQ